MLPLTMQPCRVAALALAATVVLIGAACAPSSGLSIVSYGPPSSGCITPPASGHISYERAAYGPLPLKPDWHAGEKIQYQWRVSPHVPQPNGGDAPVLLMFYIFGPFPTRAAAPVEQPNILSGFHPRPFRPGPNPFSTPAFSPPPVANALPIETDSWSAQTYTSTIKLPTSLTLGYYVLLAGYVVDESTTPSTNAPGSQAGDVGAVIQLVSPFQG